MRIEEVINESFGAWNRGDPVAHGETFAPDAVVHEFSTQRRIVGRDAIVEAHFAWKTAMPDCRGRIELLLVDGDTAVAQTVWTGTHAGALETPDGTVVPPSGASTRVNACIVARVRDGRIVEQHEYFDLNTLLEQFGASRAA